MATATVDDDELARLVASQARDLASEGKPRTRDRRCALECEAPRAPGREDYSLDRLPAKADHSRPDGGFVVILGDMPWSAAEDARVRAGKLACPVCLDSPAFGVACAYCCRCDLDSAVAAGRVELGGAPVDSILNEGWVRAAMPTSTARRHVRRRPDLSGGLGGRRR